MSISSLVKYNEKDKTDPVTDCRIKSVISTIILWIFNVNCIRHGKYTTLYNHKVKMGSVSFGFTEKEKQTLLIDRYIVNWKQSY